MVLTRFLYSIFYLEIITPSLRASEALGGNVVRRGFRRVLYRFVKRMNSRRGGLILSACDFCLWSKFSAGVSACLGPLGG